MLTEDAGIETSKTENDDLVLVKMVRLIRSKPKVGENA